MRTQIKLNLQYFIFLTFCTIFLVACSYGGQGKFTTVNSASTLLLDTKSFPSNWIITPCEPRCSLREGEERAMRDFYNVAVPGAVVQEVYRLDSQREAQDKFATIYEVDFKKLEDQRDLLYNSPIADKYGVACGEEEVPICRSVGLYGNYVVYFYFALNEKGIQKEDVVRILSSSDERIRDELFSQ